jgi:hypothetical protein
MCASAQKGTGHCAYRESRCTAPPVRLGREAQPVPGSTGATGSTGAEDVQGERGKTDAGRVVIVAAHKVEGVVATTLIAESG